MFAPWAVYIIFAANRLRIFSLLAEKEMSADEISSLSSNVPRYLEALLDACVAIGLLRRKNNKYMNSHISDAHLVEGRPRYLGDIIEVLSIEASHWERLYNLVVNGSTLFHDETKREVTPHLFTMAMNNLGMLGEAEALANAVDLTEYKTIVDVGCGSGIYSLTLCRHFPNLHATLLDTKEVLKTTSRLVRKSSLQNRINLQPVDITRDSFGSENDVVLLSDVLYHDSSTCIQILKSAYKALSKKGILIVRGYYADPERSQPLFGSVFALGQLLFDADREFITVSLLQSWIESAGFINLNKFALTERSTCLIAEK